MSTPIARGHTVTTGQSITGLVLGVIVDGVATVLDLTTGTPHRVGVSSLTVCRGAANSRKGAQPLNDPPPF